jgi:hypothetical protein
MQQYSKMIGLLWVVVFIFMLGFWGTIAWVGWHFVSKYW